MNKFYIIVAAFYAMLSFHITAEEEPKLGWNKAEEKMRHFRTFEDILSIPSVSDEGIRGRLISASGQFSEFNIPQLAEKVQLLAANVEKVIIIDLRMESHGFVNGLPVTWKVKYNDANLDKSLREIFEDERSRLSEISQNGIVDDVVVKSISTEQDLAAHMGFEYVRFPIQDHTRPSDEIVEGLLTLIKENPHAWLHAHCAVGIGRATTFMVIYDMFYNAKEVGFEEILERQKEIGGQDFKKYRGKENLDPVKRQWYDERLEFLIKFYQFCKESDPQRITWQEWLNSNQD